MSILLLLIIIAMLATIKYLTGHFNTSYSILRPVNTFGEKYLEGIREEVAEEYALADIHPMDLEYSANPSPPLCTPSYWKQWLGQFPEPKDAKGYVVEITSKIITVFLAIFASALVIKSLELSFEGNVFNAILNWL